MDKGPWNVCMTGGRADILSEDFTHDVMLKISGDWESNDQRTQYAEWLAHELNDCARLRAENAAKDAEIARLREELDEAYAELCKQDIAVRAVYDRDVWLRAQRWYEARNGYQPEWRVKP